MDEIEARQVQPGDPIREDAGQFVRVDESYEKLIGGIVSR